jgi:uncharacterized protein (DUF488 family)
MSNIYSIGHGSRPIEELIVLLATYQIAYLVDVRTFPVSKYNPQYNQAALQQSIHEAGLQYVYMGDLLGGRPADPSCRNEKGKLLFDIVKNKPFFQKGIERLQMAHQKNIRLAIMCAETKPQDCHRTKWIGEALREKEIPLQHITEKGLLKTQEQVMLAIVNKKRIHNLFESK